MGKTGFATIGTSKITEKFLQAAGEYPEFRYAAAYSRKLKKAEEFAAAHGAEKFYDSPENVKLIYRDGREEILYHRETENAMKYELGHFLKMISGEEEMETHARRSMDPLPVAKKYSREGIFCVIYGKIKCKWQMKRDKKYHAIKKEWHSDRPAILR